MFTLDPTPLLESLQRSHHTVIIDIQVFLSNKNRVFFVPGETGDNTQSIFFSHERLISCVSVKRRQLTRQHPMFRFDTFISGQ